MRYTLTITLTVDSPSREEAETDVKRLLDLLNKEGIVIYNTKFVNLKQQLPLVKTNSQT